jgi:putative oxidoreductase
MFARFLEPRTEAAYAFFRVMFGLLFSFHGMQKILGLLTDHTPHVGSQLWVGGIIELTGGLLIATGTFTRCAAFIASGMMAVAYVQFHWKGAFDSHFFPAINQGELAVLYSVAFFFIACRGGGTVSVDALRSKKR